MAVRFSREEVIGKIFEEDSEEAEGDSDDEEPEEGVDSQKEKLQEWIASFDGGDGFNSSFFREQAMATFLPIVRQSCLVDNGDERIQGMSI